MVAPVCDRCGHDKVKGTLNLGRTRGRRVFWMCPGLHEDDLFRRQTERAEVYNDAGEVVDVIEWDVWDDEDDVDWEDI